jgi:hypothetical protein
MNLNKMNVNKITIAGSSNLNTRGKESMTSKLVKTGDIHEKEITNVSVSLWYYENISEIESFMKNRNLFIYLFIYLFPIVLETFQSPRFPVQD